MTRTALRVLPTQDSVFESVRFKIIEDQAGLFNAIVERCEGGIIFFSRFVGSTMVAFTLFGESEFHMAKSPQEIKLAMIAGLKEKTGKPLEAWLKIIRASKLAKHKEMVTLLKTKHGLTHGYANMIALQAMSTDSHTATDGQGLVDAQYAGAKAALRPIYDALLAATKKWGDTVEVSPKKAYVSLRREKQFAIVQPSTGTRVDVGLVLPGVEPGERLEGAGSFNAMMTHRVRISRTAEVDKELIGWLRRAYDMAGPSPGSAPPRKGRSAK